MTKSLLDTGFDPDVKIIDLRSRRQNIKDDSGLLADYHVYKYPRKSVRHPRQSLINNPGTINIKTALKIKSTINEYLKKPHFAKASRGGEKQLIVVIGEEDLLALPAILFAPLNSIVLYGQFDLGVVMVEVTEEKKKEVENILKKFI